MTRQLRRAAGWAYLLNASLLVAHEIDSAYWHEWVLFGLPGGIQAFVLVHIPLMAVVLIGFRQVALWERGAKAGSFALAATGIGAYSIHTAFLVAGSPGFDTPVSKGLLWSILAVSLVQIVVAQLCPRPRSSGVVNSDSKTREH